MTDTRLKDRIAIITGASSGLGKATAFKFASAGARLVLADLKSSGVEDEITAKYGEKAAIFVPCDVTQEPQIESLIQSATTFGDRLDIIINHAGIADDSVRAHELSTTSFDRTLAVNTRGVWLCCKHALRQMLAQEPRAPNARGDRTRGWIVNTASILGNVAFFNALGYTASKHAVVGMTRQMALDYAPDRIHINALCPGFIHTHMTANMLQDPEKQAFITSRHPWGELGRPEDIADAALFLCSDEASWVTGHALAIDGGYLVQ